MASAIDGTKPVAGSPTTQSVRDNFATAASEITALQSATGGVSGMTAGQIPIAASATSVTSSIPTSTFLTPGTAASTYLPLAGGNVAGNLNVSGNVGIGTTAPQGALSVERNTASSTSDLIQSWTWTGGATIYGLRLYQRHTGSSIVYDLKTRAGSTTDVNALTFDSSGNVGIGTTAPGSLLTVNGACANVSGAWTTISDASVKESVQPYTRGLDAIVALKPVQFRYAAGTPFAEADKPSRALFGLIADDVKPHVPEIVGTTTATIGKKEGVELSTLESGNLIYALINAVKELNGQREEMVARIAALESATVH